MYSLLMNMSVYKTFSVSGTLAQAYALTDAGSLAVTTPMGYCPVLQTAYVKDDGGCQGELYIGLNTKVFDTAWSNPFAFSGSPLSIGNRPISDKDSLTVRYTPVGAETATVAVTATHVVGVTSDASDDFSLAIASYPTMTLMAAAVTAVSANWAGSVDAAVLGGTASEGLVVTTATACHAASVKLKCTGFDDQNIRIKTTRPAAGNCYYLLAGFFVPTGGITRISA